MRVERFLQDSARDFGDKTALVVGGARVCYAQLEGMANRLAQVLRRQGVGRGDRVVLFLDNSLEAVAGLFGALKAGAVFSPVNPGTKARKLAYILNNCRARALLTHARLMPVVAEALAHSPSVVTTLVAGASEPPTVRGGCCLAEALEAAPPHPPVEAGIDIDLAMVIYTSGSTGSPKGVMMTHRNVVAAATSITTYLENTCDDVILSVLPLSFDYGLYQALMAAKIGATLVLEKSFAFPTAVVQQLRQERVTGLPLVPTIAAVLLQMKDLRPGAFPHLRYITNTAAALPPAHIERLRELFPTTRVYSMYGLTECKRCTYLPPEELDRRPGSVGKAIPNTEVYPVNAAGERIGPGEVGELVVRGGHVMQGYWGDPEATARVLRPGPYPWEKVLFTGDLFRMDEEGFLYFVGRKDDLIKSRGEKVSPKEVENVLHALPGVREAAVIGVPDALLGQAVKAVIVPTEGAGLTERSVIGHCAKHLEAFMIPKYVEFRQDLPKTDSDKVCRRALQAEAFCPVVAARPGGQDRVIRGSGDGENP
jgi:amino acid adenylation domain-containing protein